MEISQQQQLKKIIELLLRRKILIVSSLLVSIAAGMCFYLMVPKVYQSTSLIMYQKQKINPSRLSPDEVKVVDEMVSTVSQQVTSRTSLEEIINQFQLYTDLRKEVPLEDVIITMREKHISISSQDKKGDLFSVSFQGQNPKKVMLVTNALASKFIEENLRVREERATETSVYVKDELNMAKTGLDKKEAVMRDYKLKYYNEMSDQREANMTRMNTLQGQYQSIQSNLQNLEQTRLLVLEQISLRKDLQQSVTPQTPGQEQEGKTPPLAGGNVQDLVAAQKQLENLLSKYTEDHPEVKQVRKKIQQMEQGRTVGGGEGSALGGLGGYAEIADPQLEKLSLQLKEIELNLAGVKSEQAKVLEQIKQYQQWIDQAPVREAEWASLTRDYEELKKHYEHLVAQSLAADSAESLERKQKGSQFKIVDPANLPEEPVKPNFLYFMAAAIFIGIGLGGGLAVGLELTDTSPKGVEELEKALNVPVTCVIPLIMTDDEKRLQKIKSKAWGGALLATSAILLISFIVLWQKGLIII